MGKELFDNIPSKVGDLLSDVRNGKVGLPDLQRPFVWKDSKARDLLDSMLKGYPIGYIMLWQSPEDYATVNHIGTNDKAYIQPDYLVIDGQQRLTALLAAISGIKVKDNNYAERQIRIAFNPLTREFAVWTEAYERNPEWISGISAVFIADANHDVPKFRRQFIKDCNSGRQKNGKAILTDDEEEIIETNINELLNLSIYTLPTLRINAKATEEDVAEVFVRVNSGGQKLTEKNFIETLLAVYDNDVHDKIDKFCADSRIPKDGTAYNFILKVDPSHLIRMAVAVGFRRARLRYAYMLMRGKDLETGIVTKEEMDANLTKFKNALDEVTNLNNWHTFMGLFAEAGYVNGNIVASSNAVVFCYVLYLLGKYDYKVQPITLQKIIKKWIFMSTITYFYTGSTESEVEKQFADLRNVKTADEFVLYLEGVIYTKFTDDYFNLTLPADLMSAAATSPAWFGYIAALNVLGTPMLFSTTTLAAKLLPGASGDKKAVDKHHIFPKNYLTGIGYTSDRDRNQIANFTYLDYNTNIDISDYPPADYVERYRQKLGEDGYKKTCAENALPVDFEKMSYPDFLEQRRQLMAEIVKQAYQKLCE
ncbi:hypothetical protein AB840_08310 [Megasphaera cerevisiae DSM 20462]|uniref:GmrSD restriction endonucleases N-terminal domain-containing protein n=1 Tax=Megasphaera cerevisiae DSM 20462 TaxID=1122219 RepID=A0A0J6WS80_9FIRM|nr:DUF262 domain-containing protein [Megasphaera cerevisiae]KMO86365.1 hypothetical protein AB840_08310 [Megasphaera cerevisiae DSM 20462]OKY53235.1 hypothetical protein BSR42_08810 [Megasphaera cerevisiae]SJZ97694.1 Uncharacterized conserved protein [Megasphaera cerevisiae DSM 20462]